MTEGFIEFPRLTAQERLQMMDVRTAKRGRNAIAGVRTVDVEQYDAQTKFGGSFENPVCIKCLHRDLEFSLGEKDLDTYRHMIYLFDKAEQWLVKITGKMETFSQCRHFFCPHLITSIEQHEALKNGGHRQITIPLEAYKPYSKQLWDGKNPVIEKFKSEGWEEISPFLLFIRRPAEAKKGIFPKTNQYSFLGKCIRCYEFTGFEDVLDPREQIPKVRFDCKHCGCSPIVYDLSGYLRAYLPSELVFAKDPDEK